MNQKFLKIRKRLSRLQRFMSWSAFRCLGSNSIIFHSELGYRLRLEFSDVAAAYQIYFGEYEPEETCLIRNLVTPGMITFDIGANIGYFTLLMAHNTGSKGKVHAFEPSPIMLRRLKDNIAINPVFQDGRIVVHPFALGAVEGTADFFCPIRGYEGVGGLKNTNRACIDDVIQVQVLTLDGFVRIHGIEKVDFIKMDIEGGELDVLRGGDCVLAKLRPIFLFEALELNTAPYGYRVFDILYFLEQRGYVVKQAGMSFNFLAVPRERV